MVRRKKTHPKEAAKASTPQPPPPGACPPKPPSVRPKPPDWRYSEAKKQLRVLLENDDDRFWHSMEPEELYQMSELFQQYEEEKFFEYLENLKAAVAKEKKAIVFDEKALAHDRKIYKPRDTNANGTKRWDRSAAKQLLHQDVKEKRHVNKTPMQLWNSRDEYKDFDLATFRGHVYQEEYAQKGRSYWQWLKEEKRKEKALKQERKNKRAQK